MTTHLTRWTSPLGLAALIIGGNVWMALIYAHTLPALGLAPGLPGAVGVSGLGTMLAGLGPLGFWGAFFGLLGLNNGLVLAAFACWGDAVRREQAARAEILAAMHWTHSLGWQQRVWLDAAPPAVRRPSPAAGLGWHLPYAAGLLAALALPATLLGLVFM